MAESAVKAAASQLGKVLVEEGKYLWGAEGKVAELRNELLWMQRFLKKAESLEFRDEIVDQWVLQIKEYVSEAEDIIDDFIIDIASKRKQVHWLSKLKRWSCIVIELWALHQAASSIDSLTLKVSKLTPKLTTYGVNPADGLKIHSNFPEVEGQRLSYAHLENKKIIGLIQDTKTIVEVLNGCTKENRKVVAIYGMGGLGKTTLATKVYNDEQVKSQFKCRAWAYISKQFQFQTVLKTLIADLTSKSAGMFSGNESDGALIRQLRDFLQKNKCLVVLDDVWETKVWDALIPAFPRDGADPAGSKVMITTRKENVAKHADPGALAKPERLKNNDSWNLLKHTLGWAVDDEDAQDKFKTGESSKEEEKIEATDDHGNTNAQTKDAGAFKLGPEMLDVQDKVKTGESSKDEEKREATDDHGNNNAQPKDAGAFKLGPEMFGDDGSKVKKLGAEMVKNCNGIPLAIVVLGGILRKKNTYEGWRLVSENISSYLRRGHDHGKSYMDVLVLSYADLPYYVKPCFLHLGNYPEDYEIQAEKLCRMWVAEGLITWPYDRPSSKESLEDIANEYLSHLEQAGMIQVMKKASDGRIRSIRMHDLMRDVCLQKATTENFFTMIDHRSCPNEPQSFSSSLNHARMLHMAIYLAQDVKKYIPDYLTSKSHKYLRSLLLFEGEEVPAAEVLDWMNRICQDFPRLRVLDIEGLQLEGKLANGVRKMKHLRYLSLKGTNISDLPSSIGNLTFLETLDLRVSLSRSPVGIPNTLWKLEKLRHLFLPKKSYKIKKSEFLRLDTLRCLEVLKNLETAILKVEDLQKLRKLKKLTIKDYAADLVSIKSIVNSPAAKSGHLRSCSLCVKGEVIDKDREILSRFDCLRLLRVMDKIKDKISPLKEYVLPQSLVEVHMESCELINDPMRILGCLTHLKHLSLGYKSFVGTTLTCNATSFTHLAELNLRGLSNLEEWTLEKGSMPDLKKLIIMDCGRLKKIPDNLTCSTQATCSPCISGIERFGTCNYYGATFSVVNHEAVFIERAGDGEFLKLLMDDQHKRVVLAGFGGIGKTTLAKWLYRHPRIKERFDAIAWVRCPFRKIPSSSTHLVEGILRQLDPVTSKEQSEGYSTVPGPGKTLLILPDFAASLEDLVEKIQNRIGDIKILLTTDKPPNKEQNNPVHYSLKPLTPDESVKLFNDILAGSLSGSEGDRKAELGRQLLINCSGHPRSIIMLAGLLAMKKSLAEWNNFQAKLLQEAQASQPERLYQLCYHDLPTYLQECFLFLSNFPENTEIPARKLYQMWIAAGFVIFRKDGVSRSSKKRKQGSGEVETLLENVAATYLNELVIRGMVQVEKRGPDKRICTCRLSATLRRVCLQKAEEKGFKLVRRDEESSSSASPVRDSGVNSKGCLQIRIERMYQLGRQKKEAVPATEDQSQPPLEVQASNETVHLQHLAVYLNQSGSNILDNNVSKDEELKSLLFFPEACDTLSQSGVSNWDCFISICDRFRFLQVLDLEGMLMIKGSMPDDVQKLSQLRYLSLKGTHLMSLPTTIQQLSRLQTLDLRIAKETTLQIPGDSFIFPHLTHLYLPESYVVTKSPSSKLQLGSSAHLQILANMHTQKVDLDCLLELKDLRRVSVNHIHEVSEFDEKLKYKGTAIEVSIRAEILKDSTRLCDSKNMQNMTIKGNIPRTLTLTKEIFPLGLKELKFKHTALMVDPIPILRELPGLTHLVFDHNSFLMKRMTFTVGFSRLNHLTLRQLSTLDVLDMTEADHLRHIEPVVIDCWRLKVMPPTGEIEVGPLEYHPLMELLLLIDADEMEEEEEAVDMEKEPVRKLKSIRTISFGKRTRRDSLKQMPKKSGLGDVAGPSAQVGDSRVAAENSNAELVQA